MKIEFRLIDEDKARLAYGCIGKDKDKLRKAGPELRKFVALAVYEILERLIVI